MSAPSTTRDIAAGDFIVVGGGVIGLTSALALAERGFRVTLVERAPGPASEASGAAAGIVTLLYPWEYPAGVQALARYSRERYPYWNRKFSVPGLLSFDAAPADVGERVDAGRIKDLVPSLVRPHTDGAVWLRDAGAVEPRFLAASLATRAAERDVALRWGSEVIGLATTDAGVAGVCLANGTTLTASRVLVAAGAWSGALLEPLGIDVPVRPVRGQAIEIAGAPGILNTLVTYEHRYLLPRGDGRIVVGSTVEDVGFDASTTDDAGVALKRYADALLPALVSLPVSRHWAGLRPSSPEGVPLIGPVPEIAGLWLNIGHFRNGITLAPGSAELLAAMAADAVPPLDPTPFQRLYFATLC
ncbi:MAG: FAD-binding oxidoreductase [Gammaproteobacteria bacterium]